VVNNEITEHEQRTHPRIRNQLQRRLKDDDTAAFRSHQRACDVKSVLWQQLVQIVSRNAARNSWKTFSDQLAIFISKIEKLSVNLHASAVAGIGDPGRTKPIRCSEARV